MPLTFHESIKILRRQLLELGGKTQESPSRPGGEDLLDGLEPGGQSPRKLKYLISASHALEDQVKQIQIRERC